MNKERILELADLIERNDTPGLGFDMSVFAMDHSRCGTVACIAGWAIHAFGGVSADKLQSICLGDDNPAEVAGGILELDLDTANQLFHPATIAEWSEISDKHAVAVLRHLAETGVVDWSDGA